MSAPVRFAPVKSAMCRFALDKSALMKLHPLKFPLDRSAPRMFAAENEHPLNVLPARLHLSRLAPTKAPEYTMSRVEATALPHGANLVYQILPDVSGLVRAQAPGLLFRLPANSLGLAEVGNGFLYLLLGAEHG